MRNPKFEIAFISLTLILAILLHAFQHEILEYPSGTAEPGTLYGLRSLRVHKDALDKTDLSRIERP